MLHYALLVLNIGLIIFSGYKHYKRSSKKQRYRPYHHQNQRTVVTFNIVFPG